MLLGDVIEGVATDTGQPKAVVEAIVRGVLARIEAQARWEGQEIAGATYGRMALETERIRTGRWSTFSSRPSAPEDAFL